MLKKLKELFTHNQAMAIAVIIAAGLLVYVYGCESQVTSIIEPGKKVTRTQLNLEVEQEAARLNLELDNIIKLAAAKNQELDKQDEIRQKIAEFGMRVAKGGTVNPAGVAVGVLGLLGCGAVVDNRIKDKVIKNRPLTTAS